MQALDRRLLRPPVRRDRQLRPGRLRRRPRAVPLRRRGLRRLGRRPRRRRAHHRPGRAAAPTACSSSRATSRPSPWSTTCPASRTSTCRRPPWPASSPAPSPPGTTRRSPRTTRTPTLPATTITPVHRADDSGTTKNFTDYLAQAARDVWTDEADGEWPLAGGEAANQTSGMISAVTAGEGAIGYADESQAGDLGRGRHRGRRGVRHPLRRGRRGRRRELRAAGRARRVRLRLRRQPHHHLRRRVPDRPGQLPHRLRLLRRRRPGRPAEVLPGLRDQRGRPAGRRRRRGQRPAVGQPARAGAGRGRRHRLGS